LNSKQKLTFALIAVFFGFMLAMQFQTTKAPKNRDTRDIWQLQDDLTKAEKEHILLNRQLSSAQDLLNKYQSNNSGSKVEAMEEALEKQKRMAGVTPVSGQGLSITVKPLEGTGIGNQSYEDVTADLIRQLINELNFYGATDMSISGERIINISPIRMVHNELYINDHKIPGVPFTIKVLIASPEESKNRLSVSEAADNFARMGLGLDIVVKKKETLPAYNQEIKLHKMKPVEEGS
jgi:uncharacterized protein YlxW (UPF0749 family)